VLGDLHIKLTAQTSTLWTLFIDITVIPANHAAPAACVLGDLHSKLHAQTSALRTLCIAMRGKRK
ncbi:MAG: hypothetical protein MR959_00800, partial [Selenomonas bovis]|nr:hypothetical protein [Selenomonas bovis]